MGRRKRDDSKHTTLLIRETLKRKEKIKRYAALNHMSVSEYMRDALDIRDRITEQRFNLKGDDDENYPYLDDSYDEETLDF